MKLLNRSAVSLCTAALMISTTTASAAQAQRELLPGPYGDDTRQLQAALSRCTNPRSPCDLRLGAGVFYTDVLLAEGFHGLPIHGARAGVGHIIRPLADRALRSSPAPFTVEPTLAQPYPVLLHFARNSKVSISSSRWSFPPG